MVSQTVVSFEEEVGQLLLEGSFMTNEQLTQARRAGEESGAGLLDTLISSGMVGYETLLMVLSLRWRMPVVDLRHVEVDPRAVQLVPGEYASQHGVLPLGFEADGSLRIATRLPNDFLSPAELSSMTGRRVNFVLSVGNQLDKLIDMVYPAAQVRARRAESVAPPAAPIARVAAPPIAGLAGPDAGQVGRGAGSISGHPAPSEGQYTSGAGPQIRGEAVKPRRKAYSIILDSYLMNEAKKQALDEDKPLYQFVEDALRLALNQSKQAAGGRERL